MAESRMTTLNRACNICHDLAAARPEPSDPLAIATLEAFYRTSGSCTTCSLIYHAALVYYHTWRDIHLRKILIEVEKRDGALRMRGSKIIKRGPLSLRPRRWLDYTGALFIISLYSPLGLACPIEGIPSQPHISPNPLSSEAQAMVLEWVASCKERHEVCNNSWPVRTVPKRLIDVGTRDDWTIKLVLATQSHKYLALSHCWGAEKPLITTRASESPFRTSIPWEALPLSFQDALHVTRWLGQRYIWIDSLCILQDDHQDWNEESSKMADIFSGCELAIAASRAASCHDGFLQHREYYRCVIRQQYHGQQLVVFARDGSSDHYGLLGGIPCPFDELPLFKRGWCFQERLLAPRILHFARHELFFQCRSEDRCECQGRGIWKKHKRYFFASYATTLASESLQIANSNIEQIKATGLRQWRDSNRALALIRRTYCWNDSFEKENGSEGGTSGDDDTSQDSDSLGDENNDAQTSGNDKTQDNLMERDVAKVQSTIQNQLSERPLHNHNTEDTESEDNAICNPEVPIYFGQLWGQILSDYARLNLTYPRDVLPALSGIADLMGGAYNPGRYFAGIWERDIHYLLGWSSVLEDGRCFRPPQYTAPSFSWASRLGPLSFPWECRITSVASILHVQCDHQGTGLYGQVSDGHIVLRGKLVPATVKRPTDSRWHYGALIVLNPEIQDDHAGGVEFDTEEEERALAESEGTGQVYCFDLFRYISTVEGDDGMTVVHALLLRSAGEPLTFERFGIVGLNPRAFNGVPESTITIR